MPHTERTAQQRKQPVFRTRLVRRDNGGHQELVGRSQQQEEDNEFRCHLAAVGKRTVTVTPHHQSSHSPGQQAEIIVDRKQYAGDVPGFLLAKPFK